MYVKFPLSLRNVEELLGGCCQVGAVRLLLSGLLRQVKSPLPRRHSGDSQRPCGVRIGAEAPKGWSADQMPLDVEGVVDRCVGGEESLC